MFGGVVLNPALAGPQAQEADDDEGNQAHEDPKYDQPAWKFVAEASVKQCRHSMLAAEVPRRSLLVSALNVVLDERYWRGIPRIRRR
jgi:hypothetical protein